jgi:succinate dehydrogenase / fumarate reductase flavoprotein subunit
VEFFNEVFTTKLLFRDGRCIGAVGYDIADGTPQIFHAKAVVLATGGCGRIFKVTSNGFASTGDGFGLALEAGVPLEDMEFVQFHPTGIYGLGILISEAARAEGGVLTNGKGERFMERYAPTLKELAPRDIISRAILTELREGRGINGADFVHLDLRNISKERLAQKLPEITSLVQTYLGIDPSEEAIPVAPTCHYMMGGIPTDAEGRVLTNQSGSQVFGLYAVGECACVSVHGANRLGCNSLIDLVVFGKRVGVSMAKYAEDNRLLPLPPESERDVENTINNLLGAHGDSRVTSIREALQQVMTEKCSVFRNRDGLTNALTAIRELKQKYVNLNLANKSKTFNYELQDALELGNMLKTAEVIVFSALNREESRGSHFRNDYPERNDADWLKHTLVHASNEGLKVNCKPIIVTKFYPEKRRY